MINNITRISILTALFAGVASLGVVFSLKAVYAHTFSGGESAT
jgi:hypothetical protein